jgi:hypothetical protein
MKEFWDQRYTDDRYAYGKEPNVYFKRCLDSIPVPGRILLPAEGEGRNAVYAASKDWTVSCYDISSAGYRKAMQLAAERGVSIDYRVGDLGESGLGTETFDCVALIYAHMNKADHRTLAAMVRPGGYLIVEGFAERHLDYQLKNPDVGGPKNKTLLLALQDVVSDFSDFEILDAEDTTVHLNEGLYHSGEGAVVRFFGRKPLHS